MEDSMTSKQQVREIKKILDALAKADRLDNDTKDVIHDRQIAALKSLPKENILNAVNEAIGNNPKRKNVAVYVFSELYDIDGIKEVFLDLLSSSDAADRSIIIQTIGLRRLRSFVPILNVQFYKESDPDCKGALISTSSTLKSESSFPIFLELSLNAQEKDYWRLAWAFKNYAKDEGRPFLQKVFNDKQSGKSEKVVAAWGLVKIGERSYYDYLLKMLYDPDIETSTSYSPGESIRAAQAICDINNWDFVWNKDFVDVVRGRLRNGS